LGEQLFEFLMVLMGVDFLGCQWKAVEGDVVEKTAGRTIWGVHRAKEAPGLRK